jgi:glycosyl hydrolase family 16
MARRLLSVAALAIAAVSIVIVFQSKLMHGARGAPAELDMSRLSPVFSEDFDAPLNVSPWGPNTRWIAHTPWHGDFGDAQFADPRLGFPFTISDGILHIEARKDANGKWQSGLLSSADENGRGFSQVYGYFEMRAKLPPGPGVWPAFWLGTIADKSAPPSAGLEVDALEYYGHAPDAYQANIHVWQPDGSDNRDTRYRPHSIEVPFGSLTADFNTYGVLVTPDWIIFYLNRREVARDKTPPEHHRPLHILLNLALGSGFPIDKTPNPSFMDVDYVHAYKLVDK